MDFKTFSSENRRRCESANGFDLKLEDWTLSDWMTATFGELGEAANIIKKLNRYRDAKNDSPDLEVRFALDDELADLRLALADELADTFIYLDLMTQAAGIDLSKAVRFKFDRTSIKIGYTE